MSVKCLNHIGVAVRSIDEQKSFYEDSLGMEFEGIETVPDQKVRVAFFRTDQVRIELLEPTEPDSTIAKFFEKRGQGLHHVAYTVENIKARIQEFKAAGLRMIDDEPRSGAHQMQIAFVHPKSTFGVLTELCEPSET